VANLKFEIGYLKFEIPRRIAMLTFVQAGDYLINLSQITYIDLAPEPGVQMLHIYFAASEASADGPLVAQALELTDADAVTFLQAFEQITGQRFAAPWREGKLKVES
jgi:tryptophan synthase alpha subunit